MLITIGGKGKRVLGGLIFAVFLFLFLLVSNNTLDVITTSTGNKLRPIYKVDTPGKKIAISFDACWGAEYTKDILATLRENGVKTTFFLVNIWLKDYPEIAKLIAQEGHEIGLHSTTHPHFTSLSVEEIKKELNENHELIAEITGAQPKLFRPPFGDYNNKVIEVSRGMGYHVIQWDVDSLDWRDLSAQEIYSRVTKAVEPGSIVLFHNNGKNTAQAIEPIIKTLKEQGYEIVPISELLLPGDYYVDHQGMQKQK